jgi:hypothetical protein
MITTLVHLITVMPLLDVLISMMWTVTIMMIVLRIIVMLALDVYTALLEKVKEEKDIPIKFL